MYTQRREEEGRSIPQNYSGNAFRYPPIERPFPSEESFEEKKNKASSLLPLIKEGEETMPDEKRDSALMHPLKESRSIGWGSEELLLLGLCLLLGGDGRASSGHGGGWGEVLPYLLFLLFLG